MSTYIMIKVVPNSGKQGFKRDKSGIVKCFLKSLPEKGKANKELIKVLSKTLSLPQEAFVIVQGETARNKKIKIDCDMAELDLMNNLGLEVQLTI